MKRVATATALMLMLASPVAIMSGYAENVRSEKAEHPRIARAIHELEEAIHYMEAAPHEFGGNKAQAIADSKAAVASLRKALAYRAAQDNKKK